MKNLANCKPSEFLVQTNKIRKAVKDWLSVTDIMSIRRSKPYLTDDMTPDEIKAATNKQIHENVNRMLDSILEKHPEETLKVLALMCFIEPQDVDNYKTSDYLNSFAELIGDESVMRFFSSLMSWDQKNILT